MKSHETLTHVKHLDTQIHTRLTRLNTQDDTDEQMILHSDVISYGEFTRASPQGEELMYMWKRTFSRSLKQESLCRTKIDCSQSSFLLLQSDHRPQAGRKKKDRRHEKQPRLKVFSAHIPG